MEGSKNNREIAKKNGEEYSNGRKKGTRSRKEIAT